ncbi:IS5 family transposase [Lampropedia puyangensis]|uniref:IS5 family transposase n=1 Tax=Lampropedia puyangensis TaxID=1330072 RepID=A0A4S8FB57_9BURK|nr:IS5 family transposase [Lampropedia puyangensis]THU02832.1 IS5 family transposase [Lampropedia puyangensis]
MSESTWGNKAYGTTNWKKYNASLKTRGSLTVWLDKNMQWLARASGKRGSHQKYSEAAIQFCLTIKRLFGLALRQTLGLVESLLQLAGLNWPLPDFSTVCRRQKDLQVNERYQASQGALNLLVDFTGIKFLGEGEWKAKKHGAERRRQWRTVHLGIDANTLQIRAIVVTTNDVGDSFMIEPLLDQIPINEPIATLIGDGAYDTEAVYAACQHRQITPIIPPRKRARLRKGAAFAHRNQAVIACRRLGRAIWKDWSGYHRRSLVETKMHCFKRLGEKVMTRTFERQVTELNVRAFILNRFTELGCPNTVAVG